MSFPHFVNMFVQNLWGIKIPHKAAHKKIYLLLRSSQFNLTGCGNFGSAIQSVKDVHTAYSGQNAKIIGNTAIVLQF